MKGSILGHHHLELEARLHIDKLSADEVEIVVAG